MAKTKPDSPTFSRSRRFGQGAASAVGIACLLAIVVMVNYLGTGWYRRWDWSQGGRFALSPMTERLLQTITNDVDIVVCFDPREEAEIYGWTRSLLEQYEHGNPRIHVASVDSTRSPGTAAQVIATNQLTTLKESRSPKNFIVFNSEGRRRVVFARELSDYDKGSTVSGELEFKRIAFKGELAFSSALFAVTYPRQQNAGFVTGHGEMDPGNFAGESGYGKFASMIKEEANVPWEKISLRGTNSLSEFALLVVAGASELQFSQAELDKLDAFLRQGGRALFMMNNMNHGRPTGLENYLTNWNVVARWGRVTDPEHSSSKDLTDVVTDRLNPNHPATRPLATGDSMPVQLVLPRVVGPSLSASAANGIRVETLVTTGPRGREEFIVPEESLSNQPLPMAVAVEQGGIAGVSADRGTTRLVVIGDTYCFNNQMLDSAANRYFAGFIVNWLLDRPQAMLQIPPKPVKEYRLIMSNTQQRQLTWILLAGMPGGALLFGGLVWLRRRR
jgi:hypothetical protein